MQSINILIAFKNSVLESAIQQFADTNNYKLVYARENTPDIIAIPAQIVIYERSFIGESGVLALEAYLEDVPDEKECYVEISLDVNTQNSINHILDIIYVLLKNEMWRG